MNIAWQAKHSTIICRTGFFGFRENLIVVPFVGKYTFKCKTTSWVACLRPRPSNSAAFLRWYSDFQTSPTHRAKESRLYIPRTCARSSFAVQNSCNDEHASLTIRYVQAPNWRCSYTYSNFAFQSRKAWKWGYTFTHSFFFGFFCLVPRGLGTRLRPSDIFIFSHVTTCMLICSFM